MGDNDWNLKTISRFSTQLSSAEPDIVCFPELATSGYSLNHEWRKYAEPIPGSTSNTLSKISQDHGFYLICGTIERDKKSKCIFDSAVMTSPSGDIEGVYRKVHLWGNERKYFTQGNRFRVFNTKIGKIGLGICYDLEFPESARQMALDGAQMIFYSSAQPSPMERIVDVYIHSRASENCLYVCHSNRVGREGRTVFFGESQIASPLGPLVRKGRTPGYAIARLDLSVIPKLRKTKLPYLSQRVTWAYSKWK
jgi:predicted amidohydrolase